MSWTHGTLYGTIQEKQGERDIFVLIEREYMPLPRWGARRMIIITPVWCQAREVYWRCSVIHTFHILY